MIEPAKSSPLLLELSSYCRRLLKSEFLKLLRTPCRVERSGPRQQTKRGILGKHPWAAARLLPGNRGLSEGSLRRASERGPARGGPQPPKKRVFEIIADAVPSRRGGPRQQTTRGILVKPPWAAGRRLAGEPGTRGRCAVQAWGPSCGGPHPPPKVTFEIIADAVPSWKGLKAHGKIRLVRIGSTHRIPCGEVGGWGWGGGGCST
jgi:hypothetical protein